MAYKIVGKPVHLIEHFFLQKRSYVKNMITTEENLAVLTPSEKLARTIEINFEYVHEKGMKNQWANAIAILADPMNGNTSLLIARNLSDDLVHAAGLTPTRLDWYSERLLLLTLYSVSELFFLTDSSSKLEETRGFIRRGVSQHSEVRDHPSIAAGVKFCAQTVAAIMGNR